MQFSLKLLLLFGADIAFAQVPRQGTYCEQFNDETTCRENSCAFFGGQGSCESLCSVHEDTWAFLVDLGVGAPFYPETAEEDCMMRCLNTPTCTVYSIFNGACRIGSSVIESIGNIPGAILGECVEQSSEVQMPTTDGPTLLPSQSPFITSSLACEEFKEEMVCRENGCAFFAEGDSCEPSCLVYEDTWAFLVVIGSPIEGSTDEACMMRCLNTADCAVYSTFNGVCRLGSSLDASLNGDVPLVTFVGSTYGVCLTRLHEPTANPTSDQPSEMPIRSTTTDYQTTAPTYDAPDAELLNSMGSLLERDPSAARFVKVGRRAADFLRQKKLGVVLHPDVRSAMRTIKNLMKRGFTESRWNKMVTRYQTVRDLGY